MCDGRKPKNLVASITAKNQATGRDLFTEASRLVQMDGEQRAFYERLMAREYGIKQDKEGHSVWDVAAKHSKNNKKPTAIDSRLYVPPSTQFRGTFFDSIDRKMTAWSQGKNPDMASFQKDVTPEIKKVINAIDTVVREDGSSTNKLNAKLRKFGLNVDTLYDARHYLDWLSEGGHLKSQGEAQPLVTVAAGVSRAQAALNLKWTLGNGVDMMRVMSHYLVQPKGWWNTLAGLYQAAKATKGNPFAKIESLKKAGVYDSIYLDRGGAGNLNPFE